MYKDISVFNHIRFNTFNPTNGSIVIYTFPRSSFTLMKHSFNNLPKYFNIKASSQGFTFRYKWKYMLL